MIYEIKLINERKTDLETSLKQFNAWWAEEINLFTKRWSPEDVEMLRQQSFRAWEGHRKFSK